MPHTGSVSLGICGWGGLSLLPWAGGRLVVLSSRGCCLGGLCERETPFDVVTFLGAFNGFKGKNRETSSLESFLARQCPEVTTLFWKLNSILFGLIVA